MHYASDLETNLAQYQHKSRQVKQNSGAIRKCSAGKLFAYTAAASSAFVYSATADAAIIYSGVQNINSGSVNVNFYQDATVDFSFSATASASYGSALLNPLNGAAFIKTNVVDVKKLASGSSISAGAGVFRTIDGSFRFKNNSSIGGSWSGGNASSGGFAGVKINNNGTDIFAWLRFTVQNNASGYPINVTLVDWAYEDSGAPIIAGATTSPVPLPGSLGLLAMGASGLAAFRRRKKKASE